MRMFAVSCAMNYVHCTPDELLDRLGTTQALIELMAYFQIEAEDRKKG
ncbi:MAG: hypothetical protein ACR2KM_04215 [Gemmatimonadaceae bacterium]